MAEVAAAENVVVKVEVEERCRILEEQVRGMRVEMAAMQQHIERLLQARDAPRLTWQNFKRFCQDNEHLGAYANYRNFQAWKRSGGTELLTVEDATRGGRGGRGGRGRGGFGGGGSWRR